jgi:selenocysteine-specific elongation factor
MEPDRWAEERRRGMTIDLGFAWTTLTSGNVVAFVDVPGHQRFISNMLAGIGPVPAVMFVVAADEGWCRQSAEHLAALQALDVRHGVLAVTRADLGDADLAIAEARTYLSDTTLAGMEAVAVSPVAGTGLEQLKSALGRLVDDMPPAPTGHVRLWIDRSFTVRGAGTVVTGTLGSGSIAVGDELVLAPAGRPVRVRGIQSLKKTVPHATAVARVAVNLRGVELAAVHRGHALISPATWDQVSTVDVRLVRPVERVPAQLVLHFGSAAVPVRMRRFGPDTARLTLASPLPVHMGERALLRDPGEQRIAAGVVVLDTMPPPLRHRGAGARRAVELAAMSHQPDPVAEVRRRDAVRRTSLVTAGILRPDQDPPTGVITAGDWLVEPTTWVTWSMALLAAVDRWAAANPMSPGMPREAATREARLAHPQLLDPLIAATPVLVCDADGVHRPDATATFSAEVTRGLAELRARLITKPFAAPEADYLTSLGLTERHLAAAVKVGVLLRIGDGVFLLPGALVEAAQRVSALAQPFTLSEARQALQTTRRVAIPLFEHLDTRGVTRRVDGNRRILTPTVGGEIKTQVPASQEIATNSRIAAEKRPPVVR